MLSTNNNSKILNKKQLIKNVLWNSFGLVIPLLVAVIAIPILIEGMGLPRFGILTLAWMIVGYFSLFDLGLGRAVTQLIASKLGEEKYKEISPLFWTALTLMLFLGIMGGCFLFMISPWFVYDILNIPVELQEETLLAFYLLSLSIPIVVVSTGIIGVLEAYQYFGLINIVRTPLGILNFLGPLFILPYSNSISSIVAVLVLGRSLSVLMYFWICSVKIKDIHFPIKIEKKLLRPLLSFGGWMTVSNVIAPLMFYLDRVVIANLMSIIDVAYYSIPQDMVSKLSAIPTALLGVLFPAFSTALVCDRIKVTEYFQKSVLFLLLVLFPLIFFLALFSKEIFTLWLGMEYDASKSSEVMIILLAGAFINAFARLPYTLIQSDGRPDITAKLHLVELFPYVIALWVCVTYFGIVGAAIAWSVRIIIDMLLLHYVIYYRKMIVLGLILKVLSIIFIAALIIFSVLFLSITVNKIIFYLLMVFFLVLLIFHFIFTNEDKQKCVSFFSYIN